jgi:hypothetical protein
MSKKNETKPLKQHAVSGSLLVEIKTLLEQYRDEKMPNYNAPFHYEAEGWASMKKFIQWLECRINDRLMFNKK